MHNAHPFFFSFSCVIHNHFPTLQFFFFDGLVFSHSFFFLLLSVGLEGFIGFLFIYLHWIFKDSELSDTTNFM